MELLMVLLAGLRCEEAVGAAGDCEWEPLGRPAEGHGRASTLPIPPDQAPAT